MELETINKMHAEELKEQQALENKMLADLLADNAPYLENAHTVFSSVWEDYFSAGNNQSKQDACKRISIEYDRISALLNMASNVLFTFLRDTDAALGIDSGAVNAYLHNIDPLYRKFADAANK